MQKITDPAQFASIADLDIRYWIALRFSQLFPDVAYDPDELGHFLVAEANETLESIEQAIGFSILDDFSYDILEAHDGKFGAGCIEMVFTTNDNGHFVSAWFSRTEGALEPGVLSVLEANAVPAMELT